MYRKLASTLLVATATSVGLVSQTSAHGWSEYPAARQQLCYEQGGIWSGTPPNAACAAAKAVSGSYPFVQRNEFSINIPDYSNMQTVRAQVPDGALCYANDSQKRGLGLPRDDWYRTEMNTGSFEYVFNATAPHNPSFWQFYLTLPGADLSQPLAWADLELIQTHDDVPVENGKYRMDVTIPAERSGDAVLLVRWQRIDPVGEGFYNCSDISIVAGDVAPPDPEDPEEPTGPYLIQGAPFIPADVSLASAGIGDRVNFAVFNRFGEQHSAFSIEVTADNLNDWDRLLAAEVNGWYETYHNGNVFIGRWHPEMNHYMYFRNDLFGNYFNSRNERASGVFSITPAEESIVSVDIRATQELPLLEDSVDYGSVVYLYPEVEAEFTGVLNWQQTAGESVATELSADDVLVVDTAQLSPQDHSLSFSLLANGGEGEALYSFTVVYQSGNNDSGEVPPWNASDVYVAGDQVRHNGQLWTAQWWTLGEEPGTTGEWGVWR
ncbi:MAG: lytic polysaccharide monooxygenase [Pseudomonadota bacterium]